MKAGVIEEMVSEAIDSVVDSEDLEAETEAAVDKILKEVTGETLAEMPKTKEPTPIFKVVQIIYVDNLKYLNKGRRKGRCYISYWRTSG